MSDEEYERFEVTDYDLENEFNPGRRRISKNQQIYGIWADKEDSDNDERPSFGAGRRAKDYTAPIGFIAGGVQQAGKPPEKKVDLISDEEDEDSSQKIPHGSSSSEDELVLSKLGRGRNEILSNESDIAGLRKKGFKAPNLILSQRGMGQWEKHTKGIGAKLLLQMGYQPGKGLGKDLQGIETPIEAKLRKGRGAVGAYGPEKQQKMKLEDKKVRLEGDKPGASQWKKKKDGRQGGKYVYKTIEDVINQGDAPLRKREYNELSKVKVIDWTGPEQRVLSGYHAISGVQKPPDQWDSWKEKQFSNFSLPELLHNINVILDLCESNIITNSKTQKYNEDRLVALDVETKKLQTLVEEEGKIAGNIEYIINAVEKLISDCQEGEVPVQDITDFFKNLKAKYRNEYVMYDIAGMAPCLLKESLGRELNEWKPLEEPDDLVPLFTEWRLMLESDLPRATPPLHDPYYRLLWELWMPRIRKTVSEWECRTKADAMVDLVREWKPLLPAWILDNLLQQLILPRLESAVQDWNPLTDTIPIHSWTHPWIPFLGESVHVTMFPTIREKLGSALGSWHPSDSSARFMLLPWVGVFPPREMERFLITHIVPKLSICLMEMNAQQVSHESWGWVCSWASLLGDSLTADLLDKSFFPQWLQALSLWLNLSPDYDQISSWYSAWKSLIPEQLREHPKVKGHLRNALELMSRSVGGPVLPPPPPPPPPPEISTQQSPRFQGMAEAVRSASQMVDGFRDLIMKRCEERGIVFVPLPNRYREGRQVYRCGILQVYIDRSVLFYSENGSVWQPSSLQTVLEKAIPHYAGH